MITPEAQLACARQPLTRKLDIRLTRAQYAWITEKAAMVPGMALSEVVRLLVAQEMAAEARVAQGHE